MSTTDEPEITAAAMGKFQVMAWLGGILFVIIVAVFATSLRAFSLVHLDELMHR